MYVWTDGMDRPLPTFGSRVRDRIEHAYLAGSALVALYQSVLDPLFGKGDMEFLPLMVTSGWCAVGFVWSWGWLIWEGAGPVESQVEKKVKKVD